MTHLTQQLDKIAGIIAEAERLLVFTGAGVSTESGIPDFRGANGIWRKYDPEDFTIQKFMSHKHVRKMHWRLLSSGDLSMSNARPNPAHYAITELDTLGKLYGIVTQNVDGLHQKAGVSEEKIFQLHGDLSHAVCLKCGHRYPMNMIAEWLNQGIEDPSCRLCMGMLKPGAVLFGEPLPIKVLMASERLSKQCDVCMVLGSTLSVYPACLIPKYAVQAGALLLIVNMGPTELDHLAHIRIEGKAGHITPEIVRRIRARLEEKHD
jgi:NAD-dependent deacetylase